MSKLHVDKKPLVMNNATNLDSIAALDPSRPKDRAKLKEVALELKADIEALRAEHEDLKAELAEKKGKLRANGDGLLTAEQVLAKVFPDKGSRPHSRWLRRLASKGDVPSVRLGKGKTAPHFFKLAEVVQALEKGRDFGSMGRDELWRHYERTLTEKGREEAHRFYQQYMKGKA